MLLGNYFSNINKIYKNLFFSGISFNTKNIKRNHIFFAIQGLNIDGNKFIPIAIKKGSKIIVTERKVKNQKKINTFASVFPISNPKFVLVVILDEPKINSEYSYNYRDGSNFKLKGSPRNTSGWTTVEATGHIIEKIGPILATKYIEVN